jgi:hypothetical protein
MLPRLTRAHLCAMQVAVTLRSRQRPQHVLDNTLNLAILVRTERLGERQAVWALCDEGGLLAGALQIDAARVADAPRPRLQGRRDSPWMSLPNELGLDTRGKLVHHAQGTRRAVQLRARPQAQCMSADTISECLDERAPRASAMWQSWRATSPSLPADRDEALAAFARFVLVDSDHAHDHPRIIGSALGFVAEALRG